MTAAALKLVSSMATREVLAELVAQYQRATGQPVAAEAAGGVDVAKRVQAGEAVDVVVLAADAIATLVTAGKVIAGSRVDLVRSGVAVAVRAGSVHPKIDSEDALKRAVEAARSLSYSTGPSGVHLESTFARWGILAAVRDRIVVPPPGVPVASLVADGTAELGFQQASELLGRPGVDVVGPLPAPTQIMTIFAGGIATACQRPDAARALLSYLASPSAAEVKRRYGMEAA
jgi:molybdate transport system substrate-binding protein